MLTYLTKLMSRKAVAQRARARKHRYVPQIEGLEDRQLMTVNFSVAGDVLTLTSDDALRSRNETVVITDNGTSGAGNITIQLGRSAPVSLNGIREIHVDLKGGADKVTYNLTDSLQSSVTRLVDVKLGSGRDEFIMDLDRDLLAGSRFELDVDGEGGDDRLVVRKSPFVSRLGDGVDCDVAAGAVLDIHLAGGNNVDTVLMSYTGELDGQLFLDIDGGAGADKRLQAIVTLDTGSRGEVGDLDTDRRAVVRGGLGSDQDMEFRVRNNGQAEVFAAIDGEAGTNKGKRTANVEPFNITTSVVT